MLPREPFQIGNRKLGATKASRLYSQQVSNSKERLTREAAGRGGTSTWWTMTEHATAAKRVPSGAHFWPFLERLKNVT